MRHTFWGFCFLLYLLTACHNGEADMEYTDLMSYGVPIEIQAPDSVKITTSDMGIQKDLVLQGPDGYNIQIFYSDAFRNQNDAVEQHKIILKQSPYFKEFIQEDPKGFIYAFQIDSTMVNYGFRYIVVKGGKEITVQPGLSAVSNLEQAQRLYGYAKNMK